MNRLLLTLILLVALLPSSAWAQRISQMPGAEPSVAGSLHDRIAAVVNESVISTSDINERLKLAILSSGLPSTPEVAHRLLPQILRGLIDEQLQTQEAKRLDISVSKEEIDKAFERIQHENNIPVDMRTFVTEHGASPQAMEQQIRAGLAWSKVVQRELRPRIDIGDDEIDAVIQRQRLNAGKEEFLVSEIFLAVDTPKDEEQVKEFADNLVQQLKGGANFSAVAREFSQSSSAATGGDIGWVQEGQLTPELNKALLTMQPTEVNGPIRSSSGYHIIGLREKRTITVGSDAGDIKLSLQQAFRPFDATTDKGDLLREAHTLRGVVSSCSTLSAQLAQRFPSWQTQSMGEVSLSKIPPWLADKIRDVPVGKSSEPLSTDKGALIVFVCDRHVPEGKVDRDAIMNSIGTEKLELQARRLIRDLRRAAYIDVRLGSSS